jgi:hypothetical protein
MDGWKDHYIAQCRKMEEGAGRSTRRVLPWHGKGSEYLEGIAKEMEVVMCV